MAPIVAPDVARFTLNGTYADQTVATVLDFIPAISTGSAPSRSDFLTFTAEQLATTWQGMCTPFSTLLEYTDVSYVDLDTNTGLVGTYIPPSPPSGEAAGQSFSGNTAVRFNKSSGGFQRGQRAGRLYMAGGLETWTDNLGPNILQDNVVDVLQAAADDWMTAMAAPIDPGTGDEFVAQLVVVHTHRPTPESDPVFTGYTNVTALGVQARLASQRRRLTL